MAFRWHCSQGLIYLTSELLDLPGQIKHGFSTRHGSVTDGTGQSFDLGYKTEQERAAALGRRSAFLSALDIDPAKLVVARQIHGTDVAVIGDGEQSGPGQIATRERPVADALVTDETAAIGVLTADCVPLLYLDPSKQVIGAAHAGWRGSVAGVACTALHTMCSRFGSRPEDVIVAIGPSIGSCCYEVDDQVIQPLQKSIPWWEQVVTPCRPGHVKLDLWELNRRSLICSGVLPENIDMANICTCCFRNHFFSYRGEEGRAGSLMAVISL